MESSQLNGSDVLSDLHTFGLAYVGGLHACRFGHFYDVLEELVKTTNTVCSALSKAKLFLSATSLEANDKTHQSPLGSDSKTALFS